MVPIAILIHNFIVGQIEWWSLILFQFTVVTNTCEVCNHLLLIQDWSHANTVLPFVLALAIQW